VHRTASRIEIIDPVPTIETHTHKHTEGLSISPGAPFHSIIISVSSQTHCHTNTHTHTHAAPLLRPGTFRTFSCMWEHLKISATHKHTHILFY